MANEISTSKTIVTLNDLLTLVNDNKEIKMSEFKRQMSISKHKQTKALDYGKLDLSLQGLRTNHSGAVFAMKLNEREAKMSDLLPVDNLNYPKVRSSFETKLTFSLPLYTGGKISAYKKITKKLIDISRLDKKNIVIQKRFEAKKGFYSIVLIKELIMQMNTIKTNTTFLRKSVNQLNIEGFATKTDLLMIDSRLAEVDSLLSQLKTNKDLILHFLSFLTSHNISGSTHDKNDIEFKDTLDSTILMQNIDIQKAQIAIEIKKNQISVASAEYLPEVGFMAEYGSNDEKLFGNFTDHDYYMAGIGVKWNLYSGGATKDGLSKAKVDLLKQKMTLALARDGILLKADDIRTKIKNLNFKLNALNKEKEYKKQIFENFKESHKEHRASMNDVLIHQSKYIETLMKIEKNRNLKFEEIFKFETLTDGKRNDK
jgi:outer membrane protein TolC